MPNVALLYAGLDVQEICPDGTSACVQVSPGQASIRGEVEEFWS